MCRHLPCLPERFHSTSGTDSGTVITLAISKVAYRCIPWDPRYSSISDIQCIFHELVASWISIILSLSNISSEIWTKSRGIGSQRQLLPESGLWGLWHILTSSTDTIRHDITWHHLRIPCRGWQQETCSKIPCTSCNWVELGWKFVDCWVAIVDWFWRCKCGMTVVDWFWTLWTGTLYNVVNLSSSIAIFLLPHSELPPSANQ